VVFGKNLEFYSINLKAINPVDLKDAAPVII
jgi:hypothetical protein